MTEAELKNGYQWAYREFYTWKSIAKSSLFHGSVKHQIKHFFYSSGWKKFEAFWKIIIEMKKLNQATPILEAVLSKVSSRNNKVNKREQRVIKKRFAQSKKKEIDINLPSRE